jgi:hypothetical protein
MDLHYSDIKMITLRSLRRNPEISFASPTEMSLQPDVNIVKGLTSNYITDTPSLPSNYY